MYIGILFKIGKTQKQPRYPSLGERINCVHPENGILFTAQKNYEAMEETQRKVKCLLLNERSQSGKAKLWRQ